MVSVIRMTNRRRRLMLGANGAYRDVTKLEKPSFDVASPLSIIFSAEVATLNSDL